MPSRQIARKLTCPQCGSDGEFGLDGARSLAHQSHGRARAALAQAAPAGAEQLEQITDFIATRTY